MGLINYDDPRRLVRRVIPLFASSGISVVGTNAADTELVRLPVLDSITVDTLRAVSMTGGTAAGPQVNLGYSLGGTGVFTSIGSIASGTDANNAVKTMTVASTALVAGDQLILLVKAGTVAASPKINFTIGYVETLA